MKKQRRLTNKKGVISGNHRNLIKGYRTKDREETKHKTKKAKLDGKKKTKTGVQLE